MITDQEGVRSGDAAARKTTSRIKPWLPYWAVLREDIRQTLHSWVYRTWVILSLLSVIGFMHYRVAQFHGAGIIQHASELISDLLRWCVVGSVTLIIVLTTGSISGERGTLADSVLSRGISRYQDFLGKWHARLLTVLGTFFVMALTAIIASVFLLHADVHWLGSLGALLAVACIPHVRVHCGVDLLGLF